MNFVTKDFIHLSLVSRGLFSSTCLTHLKYFISWQNSDWSHTGDFIQHIQAVYLSFTLRPCQPASLPSHVFLQLQHSLFIPSSNPATRSSPVPWPARALFCDPHLTSVLSPLMLSLANKNFFTYHLTNNHFHPPAQFLSLLKFNPLCLIQIDVLTDLTITGCSLENMTGKFLGLSSSGCTGLTCSTQSSNFKESPILREANIPYICNLLEMQLLKNLIKLDQECVKCNFSNVHNFAKCGWILTGVVKKAYPGYKLQIPPLHKEKPRCSERKCTKTFNVSK